MRCAAPLTRSIYLLLFVLTALKLVVEGLFPRYLSSEYHHFSHYNDTLTAFYN